MFRRTGKNLERVEKKSFTPKTVKKHGFHEFEKFSLNKIQFLLETFFSTRSKIFSICQNIIT